MRAALISLGCKVNQAEIEDWSRKLKTKGWQLVKPDDNVFLYIVNVCTVTQLADRKSRQKVKQILKNNSQAPIIVTGCLTQNQEKFFKNLNKRIKVTSRYKIEGLIKNLPAFKATFLQKNIFYRTRSLVKIQDGCNKFCAYCVVPYVRGPERSIPLPEILETINQRIKEGFKEIVLTGVNLGRYRWDKSQKSTSLRLFDLIKTILDKTTLQRLRLSSIEPSDFDLRIISLFKDKRLCRHLHFPLQSGSDRLLKRMSRDYLSNDFYTLVKKIQKSIPGVAVTGDVIVGLPGETDDDFRKTYQLIKKTNLAKIHIFRYSSRPYTKASSMSNQVSTEIKKSRSQKLLSLNKILIKSFQKRFLKEKVEVLFEEKKNGFWQGFSDNYLRVLVKSNHNLFNKIKPVILKKIIPQGILGEIAKKHKIKMIPLIEIKFLTDIFNRFLSIFPFQIQWLVSLIILISLTVAFVKMIRYHWLFILLLVILVPALVPLLRSFFLSIWEFFVFLTDKIKIIKPKIIFNSLR